jgi:hypothetical protein
MLMNTQFLAAIISVALAAPALAASASEGPPGPEAFFSFRPGAEGKLLDYGQIVDYLRLLDKASPRLEMRQVGETPLGKPMFAVFISSEENIARLDELEAINRRLALDPAIPEAERAELLDRGRVFILATLSMHADELAPAQSFPLYAHELVTSSDAAVARQLDAAVWMVVPSQNPDGLDMVVDNYRKYRGTPWEGASLPAVYHRYIGHDNNRDYVTLSQEDTRVISRLYSTSWFPQVMVEKHGMGSSGPRYFVPPNHDPIAENVDAGLWSWVAVLGTAMAHDMSRDGLKGVAQHWAFDNYWPGSTETSIWKGSVSLLTEVATSRDATPVYIEPGELEGDGKGLAEYKMGVNLLDPWPGGWWRLSDGVDYELSSFRSLLRICAERRADLLRFRNDVTRREVARGQSESPAYFVLPARQHDRGARVKLVNLLAEHGVEMFRLPAEVAAGGRRFEAGSIIVPLAQPYRSFVKEVLELQRYPVRHYTSDGEMIRPYDITTWSLPLQHGVTAEAIDTRAPEIEAAWRPLEAPFAHDGRVARLPEGTWGIAFSADENEAFRAGFLALKAGLAVSRTTGPVSNGAEKTDAANAGAGKLGDSPLPAGSFVIRGDSGAIDALLQKVTVPPVVLSAAPEATLRPLTMPRVALVETYFHDMDAGWTRFLFDGYGIPFQVVHPGEIEKLDLAKNFDLIVFPDNSKEELLDGRYKYGETLYVPDLPPEYREGIGADGMAKLLTFTDQGGIILAWGGACDLFLGVQEIKRGKDKKDVEAFQLPVLNIGDDLEKKGLAVPGSWLRARFARNHPLTWGMPDEGGIYSEGDPVFRTWPPGLDTDRRVLVNHPEEKILVSGFAENEKLLGNAVVGVWARKGRGQFVLYGFAPQFRGSTPATYKLLFNALLLPRLPADADSLRY